jgi:hypothetical protein
MNAGHGGARADQDEQGQNRQETPGPAQQMLQR